MKPIRFVACCMVSCSLTSAALCGGDEIADLVAQILAVGPEGAGAAQARRARDRLAAKGPEALLPLLAAMDTPDTVAANWLRSAFDELAARALQADPARLPAEQLAKFVLDAKRHGRARRLALELLAQVDASAPQRLIPPLLADPEFRYDAVATALDEAARALEGQQSKRALSAYGKAFDAARDENQVRLAAEKLRSLGRHVSIVEHLGFVVDWHLIGPFDGPDFATFSNVYPPEKEIDLQASYNGKTGKIAWQRQRTPDDFGTVDLIKALGVSDGAAAYAYTAIQSDRPRKLQIRGGADDNLTIWLNGEKVFAKEEWQNGTRFDRFVIPVVLQKGANRLLVKVCQAPPYRDPELGNAWSLQLRLCDETGKGVSLPTETDKEPPARIMR